MRALERSSLPYYSAWNSWRRALDGAACGLDDRTFQDFLKCCDVFCLRAVCSRSVVGVLMGCGGGRGVGWGNVWAVARCG